MNSQECRYGDGLGKKLRAVGRQPATATPRARCRTGPVATMTALMVTLCFLTSAVHAQIFFDQPPAPGANFGQFLGGPYVREFAVVIPSPVGGSPGPRPVLIALHGTSGNIADYIDNEFSTLTEYAIEEGWFVVVPQALPEDPINGGKIRWNTVYSESVAPDPTAPDDLAFIWTLLEDLSAPLPFDANHVYVTGFSGGATMAQLLAATQPGRVAALAASGGSRATLSQSPDPTTGEIAEMLIELPAGEGPVPALLIHGSKEEEGDNKRPYAGGLSSGGTPPAKTFVSPVWDQVAFWIEANGCSQTARVELGPDYADTAAPLWDIERWRVERYRNCSGRTEVVFVTALGLGHSWPKHSKWGFDGDRLIIDFLKRF